MDDLEHVIACLRRDKENLEFAYKQLEQKWEDEKPLVTMILDLRQQLKKAEDEAFRWQQKYENLDGYIAACLV